MKTNIIVITGPWELGIVLDRHVESSHYAGDDSNGNPIFDTTRTELGEALLQLKYRDDFTKVNGLADAVIKAISANFPDFHGVVPVPPTKQRKVQPVFEIAKTVAHKLGKGYYPNALTKLASATQIKDLNNKDEKVKQLLGLFQLGSQQIPQGSDILLFDDLYSTGASLEAACQALRTNINVRCVYVLALTKTKA